MEIKFDNSDHKIETDKINDLSAQLLEKLKEFATWCGENKVSFIAITIDPILKVVDKKHGIYVAASWDNVKDGQALFDVATKDMWIGIDKMDDKMEDK